MCGTRRVNIFQNSKAFLKLLSQIKSSQTAEKLEIQKFSSTAI